MQLSAPTLPIDPIAARPSAANGSSNSFGTRESAPKNSDFGALLSAEAEQPANETNSPKPAPTKSRGASVLTADSEKSAPEKGETDEPSASSPPSGAEGQTSSAVDPQNAPVVVILPQLPTGAAAPIGDLALGAMSVAPQSDAVADGSTLSSDATEAGPEFGKFERNGRPFLSEAKHAKHENRRSAPPAYGLSADGSPARNLEVLAQTPAAAMVAPVRPLANLQSSDVTNVSAPRVAVPTSLTSSDQQTGGAELLGFTQQQTEPSVAGHARAKPKMPVGVAEVPVVTPVAPKDIPLARTPIAAAADRVPDPVQASETLAVSANANPSSGAVAWGAHPFQKPRGRATLEVTAEKIADRLSRAGDFVAMLPKPAEITSITADKQILGSSEESLGINAAKPEPLMPATASLPEPATASLETSPFDEMPLSLDALVNAAPQDPELEFDPATRRAVEAALHTAEQFTPGDQRSVRLQFNVGGEDLAVQVEMRGQKVHTTFRTDSPELCTALAREWQSVASVAGADRAQRLADPIFSSSSSSTSGQSSSSDGSAAREQDARAHHAAAQEFAGLRRSLRAPSTGAHEAAAPQTPAQLVTSRRLHTFA
jgi:hypothetical protein